VTGEGKMKKSLPLLILLSGIWNVSQAQPTLISPANGSTMSATDTLEWSYSSPVLNVVYVVKWSPDSTFPATAESTSTLASTTIHAFGPGAWYWKVKAQGLWSVTWHFTAKTVSVVPFNARKAPPLKNVRHFNLLGRVVNGNAPLNIPRYMAGFAYR
jgi:hypothetical protein